MSEEKHNEEQERRINTYKDLVEEEQRWRMKYRRDKASVTDAFNGFREVMQPASQALGYMNRLFGVKTKPGIISHGADIAIDLFSKKYLFKRSNWFVTLAGSYVLRAVSQLFLNRGKTKAVWTKEGKRFVPDHVHGNGHGQAGTADMLNQ